MVHSSPQKSTRQQLVKVLQVPCLYRHALNHGYYGIKKVGGKRKEHALRTTDRKLAERRLKSWLDGLSKLDTALEHMTLRRLVEKLQRINRGKAAKTQATDRSIIKKLEKTWPADFDMKVMDVRPSHLNEWLSLHEKRLKHTTYNRYAGLLKQLFQIAVDDRIIVESPASKLKTPWKRPQKPVRHVPTADQFKALVNSIRNQPHSDTAHATADFVEFLGLAGVGQAEASHLTWGDIDWQKEKIHFRRRKTQNLFHVPFYHYLKFFMNQLLRKRPKNFSPNTKVFHIKDAKVALANANKRLGFDPPFSQRNLRQHLIQQLWHSGVDLKYLSQWQGHQDGGQLILDTYTETFGSNDQQHVATKRGG